MTHVSLVLAPFFFFTATATTEIYTLSLHDALPIWPAAGRPGPAPRRGRCGLAPTPSPQREPGSAAAGSGRGRRILGRKSTRLNSSHRCISYAVFCLKKKIKKDRKEVHTMNQMST